MIPPLIDAPLLARGPHTRKVKQLVVHSMAEYVVNKDPDAGPVGRISAHAWLQAVGLSAHALVRPDGAVLECVPLEQRAYHAKGHNDGTVGVELLLQGEHDFTSFARALGWDVEAWAAVPPEQRPAADPYRAEQYEAVAWWLERAARRFELDWQAVTSHDRLDPDRKFDPGPLFGWLRLEQRFAELALIGGEAGPPGAG